MGKPCKINFFPQATGQLALVSVAVDYLLIVIVMIVTTLIPIIKFIKVLSFHLLIVVSEGYGFLCRRTTV